MKSALLKAFIVSAAAAAFCVAVSVIIGIIRGSPAGVIGISLSLVLPLITAFPTLSVAFIRNAQLATALSDLEKAHLELQTRSKLDFMTGLYNREAFFDMMRNVRSRVDNGALLLIDADHFKNINDQYGHTVGDRALKLIAFALQNVTRKGDLVGRVGGEEFCVYLPHASRAAAISVGERIRIEIENTPFYISQDKVEPLTISAGGAMAQKADSNSQIFSRADHCLYEAKNQGRNCIIFEKADAGNVSVFTPFVITDKPVEDENRRIS
ncbi:GGDEF domain-containing protein [Pseudochrobactrum sp. MP213Fo]|uniref:GGDEF domain-containing protein n=1 Tax=Pseudochrobactrum sp. MP213Fo TaxID=3022250 RepID=UPI003BA3BFE3